MRFSSQHRPNRRKFMAQVAAALTLAQTGSFPARAAPTNGPTTDFAALTSMLSGGASLPGAPDYDRLRRGDAAKFDFHPAAIAHCKSAQDVSKAVTFAREHSAALAVRCGGHSYAGFGSCDRGLVLDLSGLREIFVDPQARTVRVGGGVLVGDIDKATAQFDLATTLGECPGVGIGGLATGGGVGKLMGKYGLTCDNLLTAEMVLADGRIATASAQENPDLYWAVRGGGGNFGVVTTFTFRLHPMKDVLAGNLFFRMDDDGQILREFRAATANAPDELTLFGLVTRGDDAKPVFGIEVCYCGDQARGEEALAALRQSKHLLSDSVKLQSYLSIQSSIPANEPPSTSENRTGFLTQLGDDVIAILKDAVANSPANYIIWLVHFHGAVAAVPVRETAFSMRGQGFGYGITAQWDKPAQRISATQWTISLAKRLAPLSRGSYVNMMDRENSAAVRAAYGPNYERLAKLKRRYDPANLFALNQNIRPA